MQDLTSGAQYLHTASRRAVHYAGYRRDLLDHDLIMLIYFPVCGSGTAPLTITHFLKAHNELPIRFCHFDVAFNQALPALNIYALVGEMAASEKSISGLEVPEYHGLQLMVHDETAMLPESDPTASAPERDTAIDAPEHKTITVRDPRLAIL